LGSTLVTGIQANTYAKLRKALGLKDQPVKIIDPFQMEEALLSMPIIYLSSSV
jgi:hypothetical protein